MMLEFENQAFLDIVDDDGLVVMAKGLGLEKMFENLLKIYCDPGNLVIVIGTTNREEQYFISHLENHGLSHVPRIINSDCSVSERRNTYMQGGTLFVTARILVVDLLTERIPIELITGILVYRAHKVVESAQEAFILRLFREKNKVGFIKGFSECPNSFTSGFCRVERIMRHLFVRKLQLWPRFHAVVNNSLEKCKPEVVEIHVSMTKAMLNVQSALLNLISTCIKELKSCNPNLDTDEFTVENAIGKTFNKLVKIQLDPVWNQLTSKSKQLVEDIKRLANLLSALTQNDCVSYFNLIHSLRANELAFRECTWLFLDSAQFLYLQAKERVYGKSDEKQNKNGNDKETMAMTFEENPKWSVLNEVLKEIREESAGESGRNVLILAQDESTCNQIRGFLVSGSQAVLARLFEKTSIVRGNISAKSEDEMKKKQEQKLKDESKESDSQVTLTQLFVPNDETEMEKEKVEDVDGDNISQPIAVDPVTPTFVEPFKKTSEPFHVVRLLQSIEPEYVIMYDADVTCVRQLEVYQAKREGKFFRVYFLIYGGSAEEQRYLTILRKEKEAFELLIKEKGTMVIPEEREGKQEITPELSRDPRRANETVTAENTRKGGGSETSSVQRKILVDMREFSSDLPALIHRRGINIVPLTLEVGDYILTPEICVERKSLSDLIGSLNTGRLYNQAVAMCRTYKQPMLLIEFDQSKAFSLQCKGYMNQDLSPMDLSSKLSLLTLHFPQLRLLWCVSPYATAELFDELKVGKPQPDEQTALRSSPTTAESSYDKYNAAPQDFLSKLPGVNSKNCYALMNKTGNIAELSSMSEQDINDVIENMQNSKLLWEAMHLSIGELETKVEPQKKFKSARWSRKKVK